MFVADVLLTSEKTTVRRGPFQTKCSEPSLEAMAPQELQKLKKGVRARVPR
jgi:hypothetical protein